jgi:sec-independent protein translocase protein TatA
MPLPGGPELLVILAVLLLLFGASRLPALARSMGESAKELKKGFKEGDPKDESSV